MPDKICELFNVADRDHVSRPALQVAVEKYSAAAEELSMELFCENPNHRYFLCLTETELAPMRRERIRRLSGGYHG